MVTRSSQRTMAGQSKEQSMKWRSVRTVLLVETNYIDIGSLGALA